MFLKLNLVMRSKISCFLFFFYSGHVTNTWFSQEHNYHFELISLNWVYRPNFLKSNNLNQSVSLFFRYYISLCDWTCPLFLDASNRGLFSSLADAEFNCSMHWCSMLAQRLIHRKIDDVGRHEYPLVLHHRTANSICWRNTCQIINTLSKSKEHKKLF